MLIIKDMERDYTRPTPTAFVFLAIIAVVFLGLAYYLVDAFLINKSANDASVEVSSDKQEIPTVDTLPVEDQLKYLSSRSAVKVSEIQNRNSISSKVLPVSVLNLLGEAQNISAESVVYSSGKKGFEVTFTMNNSSVEAFKQFTSSVDRKIWNIVSASYTEKAGVISLESKTHQTLINFTQETYVLTQVKMIVTIK
ncbi:MAG: hypothetical protein AB198_01525 [Parcubacteria bacterium C7867-003]|nr:MAG: hypothetical protein AB198_01525 [Parcubacteria bacterium C7867-003]